MEREKSIFKMLFLPLKKLEKEIDNLIQDKFLLVNFHDNLW